jgi:hypothetical protein
VIPVGPDQLKPSREVQVVAVSSIQIQPGMKFGKLTVISKSDEKRWRYFLWLCKCECGKEKLIVSSLVRLGKGCGCMENAPRHGHSRRRSRVYQCWKHMRRRCTDEACPHFQDYGGRGITVCERWNTFENFLADMGEPPQGHTIERKDNNGNYEPGNCRWATPKEQARNTRRNHFLTFQGRTQCVKDWAMEFGIKYETFRNRIKTLHWSFERAMVP